MSRTASVGYVAIFGRPMCTSQDFVNWVCGNDLDPRFLSYLLQASRWYLQKVLASGAVHRTIYMPTVEAFRVCVPPVTEQRKLVERIDSLIKENLQVQCILQDDLECFENLPRALLRHAFSEASLNGTW